MKVDASLGTGGNALRDAAAASRAAERLGFDALWTSETRHDAFLPLAVAAGETRRLGLGTAIAVAFSRSPMEMAQTAWDLQDFSGGRLLLGLGTQVKAHVTRRFSMPFDRPAARMRDYILALRAIWAAFQGEAPLDYRGEFYSHTLISPFFDPGPIEHPRIPVSVAGVNTALARLAGELCDGFQVHPFHSPEYLRSVVRPAVSEGAERAGRDASEVELTSSVFVVTGRDEGERSRQREEMRSQAAFYASTPSYRVVLDAHGWGEVGERLTAMAREGRWDEMPRLITDEMLRAFCVEADPDDLGTALRERYRGLLDRVTVYSPFVPGERDAFWTSVIEGVREGR